MRETLAHTVLDEDTNREGDLRVIQIIGEQHTGVAVEYLSLYKSSWLAVKLRDDYDEDA